jgi:hypothetical protein
MTPDDSTTPGIIEAVKAIGEDAADLVALLSRKAADNADLSKRERVAIEELIARSEVVLNGASRIGKQRRREQIGSLEKLLKRLESALATPGLPADARRDLQRLKRSKRTQLVGLLSRESMDFGGILSVTQVEKIREVLTRAKQDVARKSKAAAFLGTLLEVADISLSIAGKVVSTAGSPL